MNNKELKKMYQTVDELSVSEKQQLAAYLQAPKSHHSVKDIVTQEELEMIYAVTLESNMTRDELGD
ncbi:hypothetical protein [Vibrio renipiscarius]|uniref:Uncharacterized protein n=1 Tax=Vibrio renipiscarius TaxID=1461322 RepID=A0A0C2NR61_9VIBR|nr:hypothetical protein [Vibrio renipiscarius]KII76652.1 hypothetical protein OJ16_17915 [Vibrio renipiscarius]KII77827.1 hypothetical protein PL18_12655 [Vibrio renipiscarius]